MPAVRPSRRLVAVPAVVAEAPPEYVECMAMGHEWRHRRQPLNDEELRFRRPSAADWSAVAYLSTCAICGTARTRWVPRSGRSPLNVYRRPKGYGWGAYEGDKRSAVRAAWVLETAPEAPVVVERQATRGSSRSGRSEALSVKARPKRRARAG